ncbi:UNVERIFIED_CONTAM: hypothetical protein Sradi_3318600 [Sesamum radiatum]|uniref:Uncharacterized protein n=1 Tax=Sesamum radiatum TaxID=300843 RepID=A0AAW2R2E5_SESRA
MEQNYCASSRRAYFRCLLGTRLRNLAGGRIRCPSEVGLRYLRRGRLRCLHGTELTSPLEKDLSAYPKEGMPP